MITEKIVKLVAEYKDLDESKINPSLPFSEIGLDSLDIAEFVMQLEDTFEVEIEISPELNTIEKLAAYIEEAKKA